ncbi:MAG: hypothetical protein RJA37_1515 [Verrucomicrobiota bacterium]
MSALRSEAAELRKTGEAESARIAEKLGRLEHKLGMLAEEMGMI